jgi:hypothetical protein
MEGERRNGGGIPERRVLRGQMHERTILLRFLGMIMIVLFSDLRFPDTMFTLQTSFKPLLLKEGGGE